MRISFTDEIDGGRILYPIGRVRAASAWRSADASQPDANARGAALRALIETATEFEADAIVGVDFAVDGANHVDLASINLQRVTATGIAVKLARAA